MFLFFRERSFRPLFVFACVCLHSLPGQAQGFFFRNNDRVVMVGDSITEYGQTPAFIESYVQTRFPTWNISFKNVGLGGDKASMFKRHGIDNGLRRDIFMFKPSVVTMAYGMNDGRRGPQTALEHAENADYIVKHLYQKGVRVALYNSTSEELYNAGYPAGSPYNTTLDTLSVALQSVAMDRNTRFVDQLHPMIKFIEAGRAARILSPNDGGPRLTSDGVHPTESGHYFMAANILKSLNAPALVSRVAVDYKAKTISAENAKVSNFLVANRVAFTRLDRALPWPVPPAVRWLEKIPGFTPNKDLSRYRLFVANLPLAKYDLVIDGKVIGTYTRQQLASGLELTNARTPMWHQAQQVLQLINEKNTLFRARWRYIQVPADMRGDYSQEIADLLAEYDRKIASKEAEIAQTRVPKPHTWSIRPAASLSAVETPATGTSPSTNLF